MLFLCLTIVWHELKLISDNLILTQPKGIEMDKKIDLSELGEAWGAPFVARNQVKKFSGGMVTQGSMAVFDSKGTGPEGRFIVNRKTCYPVPELIAWLESKAEMQ